MEGIFWLFFLGFVAVLGLIPAAIADRRGHSFGVWWLFGTALFIVALPVSFFIEDRSGKKCPQCAEWVKKEAAKCRFCGADLFATSAEIKARLAATAEEPIPAGNSAASSWSLSPRSASSPSFYSTPFKR